MSIKIYFKSKDGHTQGLFGATIIIDHSMQPSNFPKAPIDYL